MIIVRRLPKRFLGVRGVAPLEERTFRDSSRHKAIKDLATHRREGVDVALKLPKSKESSDRKELHFPERLLAAHGTEGLHVLRLGAPGIVLRHHAKALFSGWVLRHRA